MPIRFCLFAISLLSFLMGGAQSQRKFVLSGYVKEQGSGENLVGVNIYLKNQPDLGTVSNAYGFYSLSLPEGAYDFVFSFIGYNTLEKNINLNANRQLDVEMTAGVLMEEIEVVADSESQSVESTEMGTIDMKTDMVKRLPALFGEVDLLKTLQLLPGVSSVNEGSSALYVRGGGPDQNLVLLDEAIVYNTGHLLGFFSVFNSDAIKNTQIIKGSMPANYGGRISSVIDVQIKEGNGELYRAEGGIGLISSRLTVQGPIQKTKSSFIVSARRTYALDIAQPFIRTTDFAGTNYYFYDLNAKVNYKFSNRDRLYLSAYFGRDVFSFINNNQNFSVRVPYGNATGTLRWNHVMSGKLFFNLALISNNYDFGFRAAQEQFRVFVNSGVRDYSVKADFDYYPNPNHQVKAGMRYTHHKLTPNVVNATNGEVNFQSPFEPKYGHETEIYLRDEFAASAQLKLNLGLRWSFFTHLGPYTSGIDGKRYTKGQAVKTYNVPEPRVSFVLAQSRSSSIKGGVTVASQYIHLVSNSASTLPTDIWVPSTEKVKPQIGIQYAMAYFRNWFDNALESSVEVYYKDLRNQLDYRESYVENFSSELENEFVGGRGRAYGIEFFIRKQQGLLTGWVGYTLSRTERWFSEIEEGRVFPASYDRPHDLVVVASYKINKNWHFSASFIYATGRTFTPIQSLFLIDSRPNVEYGPRNSARLDDYHRLDISAVYEKRKRQKSNFSSSWAFSVYNVYNRRNPFFIYTAFENDVLAGTSSAKAAKVSIFPIIPAVTWNFHWQSVKSNRNEVE